MTLRKNAVAVLLCLSCAATLISAAGASAAGAGGAETPFSSAVLGNGGELYELIGGRYSEIFPGQRGFPAPTPVLALTITWPDGFVEHRLVPETSDSTTDRAVALLYDRAFSTALVLWQSNAQNGLLRIASFHEDAWTEITEIRDPDDAAIGEPRLLLAKEKFELQVSETTVRIVERQILHMAWLAQDATGANDVRYSPIAFVDGHYAGYHDVFSLRDLTREKTGLDAPSPALLGSLDLVQGDSGRIFATFASALDGELTVAEVNVLPLETLYLGEEVRTELLALESVFLNEGLTSFADAARVEITVVGSRFRSRSQTVFDFIGHEVERAALAVGGDFRASEFDGLVDLLRGVVIQTATPLVTTSVSSGDGVPEIDLGNLLDQNLGPTPLVHVFARRSLAAPAAVGGVGPASVFASRDGRDVVIAWQVDDQLRYVELTPSGWSAEMSLVVGDGLSVERALEVVEHRVR